MKCRESPACRFRATSANQTSIGLPEPAAGTLVVVPTIITVIVAVIVQLGQAPVTPIIGLHNPPIPDIIHVLTLPGQVRAAPVMIIVTGTAIRIGRACRQAASQ